MLNFSSKNIGFTPIMEEMTTFCKPLLPYLYNNLQEECALLGCGHISGYTKLSLGFPLFMNSVAKTIEGPYKLCFLFKHLF